jgi:hypothetical protein
MRKIVLIQSFVLLTAFAGAAEYNYSVQMKESDGSVHNMGDVRINVNQDTQAAPGTPKLVTADNNANAQLIAKIQAYIKANYQGYNVTVKLIDGVVHLNGIVSSGQDRKNIEDAILKMDGVKKVDNQIKVGTFNGTNSI